MRARGWELRLRGLIDAAGARPFEWGTHDCALFAIAAYEAVTGLPLVREDRWETARDAAKLLRRKPLRTLAAEWFGEPIDGWKTARRGDVVMIGAERGFMGQPALAVCVGPSVVCPGQKGLQFEALRHSFCTWHIG